MAPDDDSVRDAGTGRGAAHGPHDPIGRATHLVLGTAAVVLGAIGRGLLRLGTESDPVPNDASGHQGQPASPPPARTSPAPATPAGSQAGSSGRPAVAGASGMPSHRHQATDPDSADAAVLALAVVGLAAEVTRRVVDAAAAAAGAAERGASALMQHQPVPATVDRVRGEINQWGERGREALHTTETTTMDFGLGVVAQVVPTVVARLDLPAIVEQVDIPAILDRIDLDAIVDRIDVERIVHRLDLTAIAQGVLDQLDLTAISQRVLDHLDLTAVSMRVIDELELGELIRESSSTVTVEAVDALRVGGMNADRFVGQLMNKILLRRNGETHTEDDSEEDRPPGDTES